MRSKKFATRGSLSGRSGCIIMISALPGTNMSSTQRFSCCGFLPSRFSQWYSMRPTVAATVNISSSSCSLLPVFFTSWAVVTGLRLSMHSSTSSTSSPRSPQASMPALTPQNSGEASVSFSWPSSTALRSVIFLPSRAIFSSLVIWAPPCYRFYLTGLPSL